MKQISVLILFYLGITQIINAQGSTSTGGELTFQMINPCGNDGDNEFVVFTSGNAPITVNDIALGSVNDSSDTSWNYFWSTANNGGSGPTATENGNSVTTTASNSYGITDPVTDVATYTAAINELNGITGATTFLAPDPSTGEIPANAAVVFFLGYDNPNNTDGFDTVATNLNFTPQVPNQFYIVLGQGKENGGYFSNSNTRTQYMTIGQQQTNVSYTPTGGAAAYLLPDGTYESDGDCIPSASLSCTATLTEASKTCSGENAGDNDTYTVVLNFTIGGTTGPFNITVSSGTADKTTISADGTITISGVAETANLTVNLQNTAGDCPLVVEVEAPACDPAPCGVTLGTPTYTCGANTSGNDAVTINIPYTGSDSTITSVTTTATGATIAGDNPASTSGGTITITGLSEGDTFNLAVNGGVCDGTSISDTTIPVTTCTESSAVCPGYTTAGVYISEISYNPSSSQGSDSDCEYIEIFNAYDEAVDISGWSLTGVTYTFPANTSIAAGEYILVVVNESNIGGCGYNILANTQIFQWTSGALGNGGESIALNPSSDCSGANASSFTYSDGGASDGNGEALYFTADGTQTSATPSPGQGDCATVSGSTNPCGSSCVSNQIVITEVMVNPCSGGDDKYWPDSGAEGDGEKEGEWVEFYNPSSSPIDISGYVVKDGSGEAEPYFTFPAGTTIGANEYFVVGSTNVIAKMTSVPAANKFDKGSNTKEFDNSGEDVTIEDCGGTELDKVVWTADNCGTNNNGLSLTLMTPEADLGTVNNENTDTAPWYVSLNGGNDPVGGGTPGASNEAGACISNFTATAPTSCPADCSTDSFSIEVSFDYARAYVTEYDILLNGNTYAITGLSQGSGSVTNQTISVPCNSITSGDFDIEIRPKGASSANKCMTNIVSITIPSCSTATDICNNFPSGGIYITEILVNPTGSEDCEYIELYNAYADPVSLSGWSVDGLGTTISSSPEFRIESGEYVLISNKTRDELNADCGFNIPANVQVIVDTAGSLTNTGEDIEILPITDCETVNHTANYNYGDVSSAADEGKAIYFTYGANGAITAQAFGATTPGEGSCTPTTDTAPACTSTCTATLEPGVVQCETATSGADTYTATWILEFGIENSVFTVSIPNTASGTINPEDITIDPSVDASPYVITVTGIPEGNSAQLNVNNQAAGGDCDLNSLNEVSSPDCSGCDVQPCLVITEIMIDPCSGSSASAIWTQEGHGEYVEILNNCTVDVDISGYQLRDERGTSNYAIFPTGSTIAAGDRLVVGSATVINALKTSDSVNAAKYYLKGGIGGFGGDNAELDNSIPDGLRLVSCLGDDIDAVDWENPSCITSNDGISAVLMDVTADNSNINTANWYPTLNGGQPQAQGGGGTPLAANEAGACISDPTFSNIQCPADCTAVDAKISFDISFDYSNSYGTEFDIYFDDAKLTTVSISVGTPPYNGTYTGTLEIDCSTAIAGNRPVEVRAKDALANACYTANADVSIPNCTATPNTCATDATLIAIQDFDSGTPSWNNPFESRLFVDPSSSTQGLFNQSKTEDGPTANPFAGNTVYGQDLTGEAGEPSLPGEQVFVFNDVDVSAYKDVTLSFSHENNLNGTNDYLKYSYVIDGVESTIMDISGQTGVVTKSDFSPTMQSVGLKIYVQINGSSDFFEMDNFQICGALVASQPVDLTEFIAVANNQNVDLTWKTASETNSSHFVIDRSFDGVHFQPIGQVTAEGKATSYTFKDVDVASQSAVVYYRLLQVDNDESSAYSNVVQVKFENESDYVVYPNPVKNNESFTIEGKEINTVDIYNSVGQLVSTHKLNGEHKTSISTEKLAKGVYVVMINSAEIRKITVQ